MMTTSCDLSGEARVACRGDANVLLLGAPGTGKTFLARRIHENSIRKGKSFVSVNLASLHDGTFESELFGHERGAFTGADQRRVGRLEHAQGGTVFLDEIGELSLRQQARLLEFLQSRTITPVGSNREIKLNVRVIAATNRDLEAAVARKEFREDLYHRLRVVMIQIRPLNERGEELDDLVHTCLEDVCRSTGRSILRLSRTVAEALERHSWPGNLREMRNVLEYAVISAEGTEVQLSDLPSWFTERSLEVSAASATFGVLSVPLSSNFNDTIAWVERTYLQRSLKRFGGRINYTARKIGINKTTLLRRMRAHGLNGFEFHDSL